MRLRAWKPRRRRTSRTESSCSRRSGTAGRLSIAVDYFDIKIDNGVDQAGAGNILPLCYDDPDFRAGGGFCRLVTRNADTDALTVSNAYTNIATQIAGGIDYTCAYEHDLGPGAFAHQHSGDAVHRRRRKAVRGRSAGSAQWHDQQPEVERQRRPDVHGAATGGSAMASTGSTAWRATRCSASEGQRASYDFDSGRLPGALHVGPLHQWEWQLTAGVRNIFDEEPPTISQGFYYRHRQCAALQRLRLCRSRGVLPAREGVLTQGG